MLPRKDHLRHAHRLAACVLALVTGTVAAVSTVIFVQPTKRQTTPATADPLSLGGAARVERAACGICGHVGAMADAAFCADCGLLVQSECFGGYCDGCCQPRCSRCAARSTHAICAHCLVDHTGVSRSA